MLENCATIDSCESTLLEQIQHVNLLGQIPFTNDDYKILCNYVDEQLSFLPNFYYQIEASHYPATLSCYLVLKGIFNYSEGAYWNSVKEDIKEFNQTKRTLLGKTFLNFIEKNGLFHVDIPRSQKFLTPILMHGIIPQELVGEYFNKIIYPLATRELVCPTDKVELSNWLEENRTRELFKESHEEMETILRDIPDGELDDNYDIEAEIKEVDQQIDILSDELQSLEVPPDLKEKYQDLEDGIAKLKSIETELSASHRKKEEISERIRRLSSSYEQNIFCSQDPKTIPPPDIITSIAESELIDYLRYIAETGDPDEKGELVKFATNLSDGIQNHSISLSDEAMDRYQTLISVSMPNLLFGEEYEIRDISEAHVHGISPLPDQDFPPFELPTSDPDTAGINLDGSFHNIESLYGIEDTLPIAPVEDENRASSDDLVLHTREDTIPPGNSPSETNIESINTEIEPADTIDDESPSDEPFEPKEDNASTKPPDLGKIAESLKIQFEKDKIGAPERTIPHQPPERHSLSTDPIQKVRDESLESNTIDKHAQQNDSILPDQPKGNEPDKEDANEISAMPPELKVPPLVQNPAVDEPTTPSRNGGNDHLIERDPTLDATISETKSRNSTSDLISLADDPTTQKKLQRESIFSRIMQLFRRKKK